MQWFRDLKVFHKIMLILVVYVLALVINLVIGRASLLETQDYLVTLEEKVYDSVQLSTVNTPLLKRADELLTQAVSFGEEDLKNQGIDSVQTLLKNLQTLKTIDTERSDKLQNIIQQVEQYQDVSVPIVDDMLGGSPDFDTLQGKIERKAQLLENINDALAAYHSEIDAFFKATISNAVESGESSLFKTTSVSAAFFVVIALLIVYIGRSISNTAIDLRDSLEKLSQGSGDLSRRLPATGADEMGTTAANFNRFMEKLSGIVKSIIAAAEPLLDASNELDNNADTVQRAMRELLDKAHEGKTAMSEITLSISEISQSATMASDAMQETDRQATQGLTIVQNTIRNSENLNNQIISASSMVEKLAEDTENVASILDVISSIAEQTNLLALNAAIEAARAGDQGRGFAVVADEVRALASKTADATTEIREVLERLVGTAANTVSAMTSAKEQSEITEKQAIETGSALNTIKQRIEEVNSMSMTIAAATEEQSIVVNNVSDIIANMYDTSETTEKSYSELASVAQKLLSTSDSLNVATSQFKL